MPRSSAAYGAIGVSLILCANVVIIVKCLGFGCKDSENRVKFTILIVNLIKIFRIAFIFEMLPTFEHATLKGTKKEMEISVESQIH